MASKLIQSMLRGRLSRKRVRKLLTSHVDKIHDPQTNSYYYFNRTLQITSWDKPSIWGEEDLEDYNGENERKEKERERREKPKGGRR